MFLGFFSLCKKFCLKQSSNNRSMCTFISFSLNIYIQSFNKYILSTYYKAGLWIQNINKI